MVKVEINKSYIAKIISSKREENDLTINDLSSAIGISSRQIGKWEKGVCIPTIDNVIKLCNYFNIRVDELIEYSIKIC